MKPYLEELNENQYKVATTIEGTIQVNATAGSGKTKTLVSRVAYMIENGISPYSIMLTTFTTKASSEMKSRLSMLVPRMKVDAVTIGTTHSICHRILRKELVALGDPRAVAFTSKNGILTEGRQKVIAGKAKKAVIDDPYLDYDLRKILEPISEKALVHIISRAKNDGITWDKYVAVKSVDRNPQEIKFYKALGAYYERYESKKDDEGLLDFDDLLLVTLELLQNNAKILAKYQFIYTHIMVDEAQDNNGITYEIIKLLAKPNNNLLLCGDEDQSLYGFRGARPEEFINFAKEYPDAQIIPLGKNYRSKPHILEVADKMISNNKQRLNKTIVPHKESDETCVFYNEFNTGKHEAIFVVDRICEHLEQGVEAHKIAVLYRTNAMSQMVEDELIKTGIPYVVHGGTGFYERMEIKDILAYLNVMAYQDNESILRVINTPSRYLGKAFLEKIKRGMSDSYWDNLTLQYDYLKNYEQRGVTEFRRVIRAMLDTYTRTNRVQDTIITLLDKCYREYILKEELEEDNMRIDNIDRLLEVAQEYPTIEDFLEYVNDMAKSSKQSDKGVQLMSIHKSKGLEFPICFVIGCTEGVFPHIRAMKDVDEKKNPYAIEEERRLMFVAITRAEDICYLTSSKRYYGKGGGTSRFVLETGLVQNEEKTENPL